MPLPAGSLRREAVVGILAVVLAVFAPLAFAVASSASGSGVGGLITQRGIGKLHLGMSRPAAEKLLKRVGRRDLKRRITIRPGLDYVEYEYRPPYVAYDVGFLVPRGRRGSVALVRSYRPTDGTREGLHVGSTERAILQTYRARARCGLWPDARGVTYYCRVPGRRREVVFLMKGGFTPAKRVVSIVVKERSLRVSLVQKG